MNVVQQPSLLALGLSVALGSGALTSVGSVFAQDLGDVVIISTTPLPGGGVPVERAPFSVKKSNTLENNTSRESLGDSLFKGISGVQKTDNQGNPYQADITYRGFSVTPLLGTPPGLSVYLDGVRQNETFGDVVRFDSIPQSALKEVSVLPGTLPQFGLNSLGGAIVLRTKSGRDINGTQIDVELGDYGRKRFGVQTGWVDPETGTDYYLNTNVFDEDGWRVLSPSTVAQIFGKVGLVGDASITHISLGFYDSNLNGNGVVPRSFYNQQRNQSFTYFDKTQNRGGQLSIDFEKFLDNGAEYSINAYYRTSSSDTFNGDGNENEDFRFGVEPFEPGNGTACNAPLAQNNPNQPGAAATTTTDNCPGANNRGRLNQDLFGLSAQYVMAPSGNHRVAFGGQIELGESDFRRSYALGVFNADRTVAERHRAIEQVNVEAENNNLGVYIQDTIELSDKASMMLAGRYNYATVKTIDRLSPVLINQAGQVSPGLNNDYSYARFNPSIGLSYQLASRSTVYASAGTSNRVPTPVELACSDPNFPCLLPNSMAADPFLKQVVTTTFESGYRTQWQNQGVKYGLSANIFRAENKDDIIFVTDGAGSGGFFQNYGKTRRQGIELDFNLGKGRWDFASSYQYLDATFQSSALLASEGNSSARENVGDTLVAVEGGFISVQPGDKIPGISEHNLKLSLGFKASSKTMVFADMQAQSDQYARGNENNDHQAGTFQAENDNPPPATRDVTFNDNGVIPGFAVFNLGLNHEVTEGLTLMVRVNNVFDREYFNGGILGGNIFDANGQLVADEDDITYETFLAPGMPRSAWLGLSYRF